MPIKCWMWLQFSEYCGLCTHTSINAHLWYHPLIQERGERGSWLRSSTGAAPRNVTRPFFTDASHILSNKPLASPECAHSWTFCMLATKLWILVSPKKRTPLEDSKFFKTLLPLVRDAEQVWGGTCLCSYYRCINKQHVAGGFATARWTRPPGVSVAVFLIDGSARPSIIFRCQSGRCFCVTLREWSISTFASGMVRQQYAHRYWLDLQTLRRPRRCSAERKIYTQAATDLFSHSAAAQAAFKRLDCCVLLLFTSAALGIYCRRALTSSTGVKELHKSKATKVRS